MADRAVSEDERRKVMVDWNSTQADYPLDRCLHQLFEAKPSGPPVMSPSSSVTAV